MATRHSTFDWPEGRRAALSLTFDDSRLSQADAGIPVLDRHGIKGTFYVLPAAVEERRAEWVEAVVAGHEIGNHSMTHPCSGNFAWSRENALEELTLEHVEVDILAANDALRQRLGVTPTAFAYPCGQHTVGRGENAQSYVPLIARHFQTGRCWLSESANDPAYCDLAQVAGMKMDGLDPETLIELIDDAIANGSWLVLCAHEVASEQHGWSFRPANCIDEAHLDELCAYASKRADLLWTDTVSAIATHVERTRTITDR